MIAKFDINFYISHEFLHFDWTDVIKYDIVHMLRDFFLIKKVHLGFLNAPSV